MGELDDATWQALGLTLTLLGLLASVLVWRRRGAAAGLRGVAWSLLPLAAALTGTLRLLWRLADAVADWAVRLVFSPFVWLGLVLAATSAVLFVVSGVLRRRGRPPAVRRRAAAGEVTATRSAGPPAADDDLADIEALLKKHGIT